MTTMSERLRAECSSQLLACTAQLEAAGETPGIATVLAHDELVILVQLMWEDHDPQAAAALRRDVFTCLGHVLADADALVFTVDCTATKRPWGTQPPAVRPADNPTADTALLTVVIERDRHARSSQAVWLRQFLVPYHRADNGDVHLETAEPVAEPLIPAILTSIGEGLAAGGGTGLVDRLHNLGQQVWLPGDLPPDPSNN